MVAALRAEAASNADEPAQRERPTAQQPEDNRVEKRVEGEAGPYGLQGKNDWSRRNLPVRVPQSGLGYQPVSCSRAVPSECGRRPTCLSKTHRVVLLVDRGVGLPAEASP